MSLCSPNTGANCHATRGRMDYHLDRRDPFIESMWAMDLQEPEQRAEPSRVTASRKPAESRECVACGDSFPPSELFRSPCSHESCRECIVYLLQASFHDESLFPPRCCGQYIPIKTGQWFSRELVDQFNEKKLEYDTPDRTYCSVPTCSTFIPPAFITNEVATCPKCKWNTCRHCKAGYHAGVCKEDASAQLLLKLAAENGWQSCNACRRLVELNFGCYHISKSRFPLLESFPISNESEACLCGAQFCYLCGVPWKNCNCPQWEEDRLIQRANVIVDRNYFMDYGYFDEIQRQVYVAQERMNLIQAHGCTHQWWRGRPGPRQCERCNQVLPMFLYECRQCRLMACRRCRYNRL